MTVHLMNVAKERGLESAQFPTDWIWLASIVKTRKELNMRTSNTHPLQIASVETQPNFGRIGITFCPGKKQLTAMTGGWDRDLGMDLDAIDAFGTSALVTLIEQHEIEDLDVTGIGDATLTRNIDWLHMPVKDVSIPGQDFEAAWQLHGPGLRSRLRAGFNIVVHCKGGLGRAGMIAASLLVELGTNPNDAMKQVRHVRPGAIETSEQESYVRSLYPVRGTSPSVSKDAITDRASGALLGLAIGDAVGTTLEFTQRDSYPRLTDMIGGGPFRLQPGQWTDDTSMALALADSLLANETFDPEDLMRRFVAWRDNGEYSCTGTCFDIGITVSSALNRWKQTGDAMAGSTDSMTAGNGSLMRLSPVSIRHWQQPETMHKVAAQQSQTTHGAAEAVSACVAYAALIAEAISGKTRDEVLSPRRGEYAHGVAKILAGSWRGKNRNEVQASGFVLHSLEAALWSIGRTSDFRSAILTAANLGGDADTTAAITGQLAGALYGVSGIPREWVEKIAWRDVITFKATELLNC